MRKFTAIPTGVPDLAMERLSSRQTLPPPRVLTPAAGVSFLSAGRRPAGTWACYFYAAALAGNHDGTAAENHVFTYTVQAPVLSCNLTGAPTIGPVKNGVTDAASYRGNISSKELVSIFGSGLASASCRRKDTGPREAIWSAGIGRSILRALASR